MNPFKMVFDLLLGDKASPQSYMFLTILVVFMAVLIPNYERVAGLFGWETKTSLKADNVALKKDVSTAVDANLTLKTAVEIATKTGEAGVKAVTSLDDKIADNDKKRDEAKKRLLARTAEIKKVHIPEIKPVELPAPATTPTVVADSTPQIEPAVQEAQAAKILAELRITEIWQFYCSKNPDPECKQNA